MGETSERVLIPLQLDELVLFSLNMLIVLHPMAFLHPLSSAEGWHDFRQEESAQYILNKTTSVTSRVDSSIIFEWLAIQHASDVKSDD